MPIILIVVGLIIAAVVGIGVFFLQSDTDEGIQDDRDDAAQVQTAELVLNEVQADVASNPGDGLYKDGVYTVLTSYRIPSSREEKITVTVELDNDAVVETSVEYEGLVGTSRLYQNYFDGAYQEEVVGKPLDDISFARAGGSSLTAAAYNDALGLIKTAADNG